MFHAQVQSTHSLIMPTLGLWVALFDGLLQPMHLIVIGIIAVLLFGRRLPDIPFWLGKKSVQFKKGLPSQGQFSPRFGRRLRNGCDIQIRMQEALLPDWSRRISLGLRPE
jgi:hypothetical protein